MEKGTAAAITFFKELLDLPKSILSKYRSQWQREEQTLSPKNNIAPSTHRQALIGTLPFLVYGIVYLIDNLDLYSSTFNTNIYLVFYGLILTGLMIGWIQGFPIWSYSYLGWSLVFAWWWTDIRIFGINWSYNVWIPFGVIVLLALSGPALSPPLKNCCEISGTIGHASHWQCSPWVHGFL